MILIADSGATKTSWRLIHSRQDVRLFETGGFNPYFISSTQINEEVDKELIPYIDSLHVKEVYFYGAGCSTAEKCVVVEDGLSPLFPNARVKIEDDLLGAARSLFSHNPGIACILGTGSNSCYFDGKIISENVPSLGYILGDEGSGTCMGKKLLKEIFTKAAPVEVLKSFEERFNYSRADILSQIYQKPFPNRFLSSFAKYIHDNIAQPYFIELVKTCFSEFFEKQVLQYAKCREAEISFTGSVAHFFAAQLSEVAAEKKLTISKIVNSPIEGLTEYHLVDLEKFSAIKYSSDMSN